MFEQGQLELFHSVLACAYEERQPLPLRLINTIKKHIVPRMPRKPTIGSLDIADGEPSCSSYISAGEYSLGTKGTS